jgi:histone H3/H4
MSDETSNESTLEAPALVIVSRIKEINKTAGYNTGSDFLDALSIEVMRLVGKAQRCAQLNGRKTLKAQDL